MQALNDTLDEMDLTDIYRVFHLKAADYIFFSSAHGIFSRTDHMLSDKPSLGKFQKIKIIANIFSDHNEMSLEITSKKKKTNKTKKKKKEQLRNTNMW